MTDRDGNSSAGTWTRDQTFRERASRLRDYAPFMAHIAASQQPPGGPGMPGPTAGWSTTPITTLRTTAPK